MSYFINDIKVADLNCIVIEFSPLHFGGADKIALKSDWPLLAISKNIWSEFPIFTFSESKFIFAYHYYLCTGRGGNLANAAAISYTMSPK
jgi:hypothetical protein